MRNLRPALIVSTLVGLAFGTTAVAQDAAISERYAVDVSVMRPGGDADGIHVR